MKKIHYIILLISFFFLSACTGGVDEDSAYIPKNDVPIPRYIASSEQKEIFPDEFIFSDQEKDAALVDYENIISGGLKKDVFKVLNKPSFDSPDAFPVQGTGAVLGIAINGQAKAYPISILSYHEVINDTLGGKAVVITYSNLCGTLAVYDRMVDGDELTFGHSGKVFCNCSVLYDNQTNSLWLQPIGGAVVGKHNSKVLKRIIYYKMTLDDFRRLYPNTKVLSQNTGYNYDYENYDPYTEYRKTKKLLFSDQKADLRENYYIYQVNESPEKMNITFTQFSKAEVKTMRFGNVKIGSDDIMYFWDVLYGRARFFKVPNIVQNVENVQITYVDGLQGNVNELTEIPYTIGYRYLNDGFFKKL